MAESSDDERNEKLKFIVLGACATGKSSICTRFGQDVFREQYNPTLGVDFLMKRISLKEDVHVAIQVWDVSGFAAGGNMLDKYLYGCHGILLVYDVTDHKTFSGLDGWLSSINESLDPEQVLPKIMLVGNKIDMEHLMMIKRDEHTSFAYKNNLMHTLVSAKTGNSVNNCFRRLASNILGITSSTFNEDSKSEVGGSGDVSIHPINKESPKVPPPSASSSSTTIKNSSTCLVS